MLTYSSEFWILFWAVIGGAAALTVMVTALVAHLTRPPKNVSQHPAAVQAAHDGEPYSYLPTAA